MKKIFTLQIAAIGLLISLNSSAQTCSMGATSLPITTSNVAVNSGNGFTATGQATLGTYPNGSTSTLVSPVYVDPTTALTSLNFTYRLTAAGNPSGQVNSYTIKVVRDGGSSFSCSNTTTATVTTSGTVYYFSINGISIPQGTNFQVYLTLTLAGPSNKDIIASSFGISAYPTPAGTVLPVKFTGFEASGNVKTNSLTWKVGTEDNLSGYNVERSADGSNFSQIGFVPATGKTIYNFIDANPASTSYYRIKSIDIDGKYGYSSVVLIKADASSVVLKAFPSPVTSNVSIQHSTVTEGTSITISSADGRLYKAIVPVIGTQQTVVDLSSAKPGLYLARYSNAAGVVSTIKIIKQ